MPEGLWAAIINDIAKHPSDIRTIPLTGGGIWFHVKVETDGVTIAVSNAVKELPSSRLAQTRYLNKVDFESMYDIYLRRQRGEKVSQEATQITRHQVYIYAVFFHCGKI